MTNEVQITFDCADPGRLAGFWHLDVPAAPGLTVDERMVALEAEANRLQALGATRAYRVEPDAATMESDLITMRDPEGNEFCLD